MDTPPVINYASPGTVHRPPRRFAGLFGWVLFIGLAVMLFLMLQAKGKGAPEVPLSDFDSQLESGNVSQVVIDGDTLRGVLTRPAPLGVGGSAIVNFRVELPPTMSQNWNFIQWLLTHRNTAQVRVENNSNLLVSLLLPLVPWFLIFAFIWFFVFRQLRRAQPGEPKPAPVYIVTPENR